MIQENMFAAPSEIASESLQTPIEAEQHVANQLTRADWFVIVLLPFFGLFVSVLLVLEDRRSRVGAKIFQYSFFMCMIYMIPIIFILIVIGFLGKARGAIFEMPPPPLP